MRTSGAAVTSSIAIASRAISQTSVEIGMGRRRRTPRRLPSRRRYLPPTKAGAKRWRATDSRGPRSPGSRRRTTKGHTGPIHLYAGANCSAQAVTTTGPRKNSRPRRPTRRNGGICTSTGGAHSTGSIATPKRSTSFAAPSLSILHRPSALPSQPAAGTRLTNALARRGKHVGDGVGAAAAGNILDDLAGRIVSRDAADATARMGAGPAHVQTGNGTSVIPVAEHGPGRKELVERETPMHDVAADKTERTFEVERAQHASRHHAGLEAGCVAFHRVDHQIRDFLLLRVPRNAVGQLGRDMLAEKARDMLSFRRQRAVNHRRNQNL